MKIHILSFILIAVISFSPRLHAQSALWVGETLNCDATSAVIGLTSDVSWSTNGGYLSLSGSGLYRNVKVTQYFSGSATVKCSWKYRLYSGDTWKSQSKTWTIRCNENPVSISPASLTLAPGGTAYVSYTHKYSNNYTSAANAYFSSSNSSIVTVSNSGLVTAVKPGTAYINVYSNLSAASNAPYCTVTVKEVTPTGVSLPSAISLIIGDSRTLSPTVSPSGAKTSFTWSSDNSDIASVSASGVVTGLKAGQTKVRVTTSIGGYTDFCNISVKEPPVPPTKIEIEKAVKLYQSFNYKITPVLSPANAETKYTWKSDNTAIVSVDSSGKITAKKAGTAIITTTTENGLEATCEISVSSLPANLSDNDLSNKISTINNLISKTFNKAY